MATWLGGTPERPARFFSDPPSFAAWLEEHHATATELWMGLRKVHVADRGLTWAEAVPEALCYGWIDSVVQRIDEDSVRQRWTPRKPTSNWSKVNLALVEDLLAAGRMRPAGIAAYERRRLDDPGYSYEGIGEPDLPPEFERRLRADPAASTFFYERATKTYRRLAITWVNGAKQAATRERRMCELIADSAAGRLIKPQRYGTLPAWARPAED